MGNHLNTKYSLALGVIASTLAFSADATTYYVNAKGGDDRFNGTSVLFPFKTIAKVNITAKAGDTVNFSRGGVWGEKLVATSGVTYQDYATGAKPIITGARALGGLNWTLEGNGIYVADTSSLGGATITQLMYRGSRLYRARHPNLDRQYLRTSASTPAETYRDQLFPSANDVPAGINVTGATARVLTQSYDLADYEVIGSASSGAQLALKRATLEPRAPSAQPYNWVIQPNMPYWLENQKWMLDAENEWYHDVLANKLYLKLPGGVKPTGLDITGSVQNAGIECTQCTNVTLRNLEVRETSGEGVYFAKSSGIVIQGVDVYRAGTRGMALPGTSNSAITGAVIADTLREGIWMGNSHYNETMPGRAVSVTGSTVSNAGRTLYALAAIQAGFANTIQNNTIVRSSYLGILGEQDTTISGNYVESSCVDFTDCGAIYLTNANQRYGVRDGYALNAKVLNNVINKTGGGLFGGGTGIYLDGFSRGVLVQGNFITNTDGAFLLSSPRDVNLSSNVVVNNRGSDIFLSSALNNGAAAVCTDYPTLGCTSNASYLSNNTVQGNTFVNKAGEGVVMFRNPDQATRASVDFAKFSNNRYVMQNGANFVSDLSEHIHGRSLDMWQALGQDVGSTLKRYQPTLPLAANASNLLSNGGFDANYDLWLAEQLGTINFNTVPCATTRCLTVQPLDTAQAAKNGRKQVSVYTYDAALGSIPTGQAHVLSFDARATEGDVPLSAHLMNVAALASVADAATIDTQWKNYRMTIKRLDYLAKPGRLTFNFEISAGQTLYLDNVKLIAADTTTLNADTVRTLINPGATAVSMNCPASNPALCGKYVDLRNNMSVSFPINVPARSAVAVGLPL